MTGFETYDAAGNLTFSTRDSTQLVLYTKLITGITASNTDQTYGRSVILPDGFTNAKATLYPTAILHPSTGATMPKLNYTVSPHGSTLRVVATVLRARNRPYPSCWLVILGN